MTMMMLMMMRRRRRRSCWKARGVKPLVLLICHLSVSTLAVFGRWKWRRCRQAGALSTTRG